MIWVDQPQNKSGVSHFCYYDPTVDLEFAWDGFALEIDVYRDDQVVDHIQIPVGYHSAGRNPGRWLAWFEVQCQIYIKEKSHEVALAGPGTGDPVRRGLPDREGQTTSTTGPGGSAGGAAPAP